MPEWVIARWVTAIGPEAEKVQMTVAEQLRREGSLRGKADTLLKQLRLRFGQIDIEQEHRVLRATPEQLEVWLERILTAESAEDVVRD